MTRTIQRKLLRQRACMALLVAFVVPFLAQPAHASGIAPFQRTGSPFATGPIAVGPVATGSVVAGSVAAGSVAAVNVRYDALYVDKGGAAYSATQQARKAGRTALAKKLAVISKTPQARWFGDWNSVATIGREVRAYATRAKKAKARPIMVLYAIPGRDCGQYSAGGFDSITYKSWIRKVANNLAQSKPLIILEPDSLAQDCGDNARDKLLTYAVKKLSAKGAWVYLDGGHSNWRTPTQMAQRLKRAGVKYARGFATNVSNFNATKKEKAYGSKISSALKKLKVTANHRNYVIDTSRNGRASANGQWCNPRGQGLGSKPRLTTNSSGLDGYLWIKRPGESDGTCNGGPAAGQWWEEYALELVKNRR